MILRSSYFMFKRMLRGYLAHLILIVLPLALITILGFVAKGAVDMNTGIPFMDQIAITQVFAFQFFGGFYTFEFIKSDLVESTKWRMYSLPYSSYEHTFSIIISTSIFNMLQGLAMVIFTHFVYDVNWGNIGIIMLALLAISILTQLVFLTLILGVKNHKIAERIGTAFGIISTALGEVWFPMPDIGIINFITSYINPFSLGEGATYGVIMGDTGVALLNIGILIIEAMIMARIAIYRKEKISMIIFKFALRRYFRQPSNIIFLLILPIILVFLPNLEWIPIPMGFQYYGVLLLFIAIRLTSIILEDRSRKTTLRICVSPITHFQYLWQNLLAYSALLMVVNILVILIGIIYHGENLVSPFLLFITYTFFSMTAIGFSLTFYAIIRNKEAALALLTGVIALISMLGGVFWPIQIMPVFIQRIAMFLPTYWYSQGIIQIAYGGSLGNIILPLVMLSMFTMAFLIYGSRRDFI